MMVAVAKSRLTLHTKDKLFVMVLFPFSVELNENLFHFPLPVSDSVSAPSFVALMISAWVRARE